MLESRVKGLTKQLLTGMLATQGLFDRLLSALGIIQQIKRRPHTQSITV